MSSAIRPENIINNEAGLCNSGRHVGQIWPSSKTISLWNWTLLNELPPKCTVVYKCKNNRHLNSNKHKCKACCSWFYKSHVPLCRKSNMETYAWPRIKIRFLLDVKIILLQDLSGSSFVLVSSERETKRRQRNQIIPVPKIKQNVNRTETHDHKPEADSRYGGKVIFMK